MSTCFSKSIIVPVLGCLLAVALLTGCTQDIPETTPPVTTTQATEETTIPPTTAPIPLTLELPAEQTILTWDETLLFQGSCDPNQPPMVNGTAISCSPDGSFLYEAPLALGENTLTLTYQEETFTYTVERRYATQWFSQEQDSQYHSGATLFAQVFARTGSSVVVSFRGEEQKADLSENQLGSGIWEGFSYYICKYPLPADNDELLDLGSITYTITCDGITETFTSGNITCLPRAEIKRSDPEATPTGDRYIDVGSGFIVEITDVNAETFNGNSLDNKSRPTNSYLPKGTVDYAVNGVYHNSTANRNYYKLRCGIRVYQGNVNTPYGIRRVVDCYTGILPDHNEIHVASFTSQGRHTELVLDCLWKAPFSFVEEAQNYDPETYPGKYNILDYDAGYVDITFCYATEFTGNWEIPEGNPLFSRAELIQNESDHTLRLFLKKQGGFYGWNAYYNENDQLCFQFLNPPAISQGDNPYGADLTGLQIMIDVGHGGQDPGACYCDSTGTLWREAERNLTLASYVKQELESIGATVIMNRTSLDRTVTFQERIQFLTQQSPDFCVCIHHNAHEGNVLSGYESWYFTGFSHKAAKHIADAMEATDIYRYNKISFHFYFVARQTVCPVVLTENGYMSNKRDIDNIANDEVTRRKAQAIVQGIANYYLEESGLNINK